MQDLEGSIECTKSRLLSSLQPQTLGLGVSLDFITKERLQRPPFPFLHALIKIYVQQLSFAKGLYNDSELDIANIKSRADKIRFLFKMFVCVANISGERVDLYVSPVKLLSGQEVSATHLFLGCLAKASQVSPGVSASVADEIVKTGESVLYKRSVKVRGTIVKLQAIVRGKCTRKRKNKGEDGLCVDEIDSDRERGSDALSLGVACDVIQSWAVESAIGSAESQRKMIRKSARIEPISPDSSDDEGDDDNRNADDPLDALAISSNTITNAESAGFTKPVQSKVEIDEKKGNTNEMGLPGRLQESNNNTITKNRNAENERARGEQMNDKMKSNDGATDASKQIKRKKVKKCKIINGIVTHQELDVPEPIDEMAQEKQERDKMNHINQLEVELKRKLKRLKEREAKLVKGLKDTREKEQQLQMYEERVTRLAENLRKQQDRLKQDGIRQAMEMDKLRLETSYQPSEHRLAPIRENKDMQFSDELLRQACDNPTITDLRLALESKERSLKKRQERMIRAEKDLRQRITEFEDAKAEQQQQTDPKKHLNNTGHLITRKKKKNDVNPIDEEHTLHIADETNRRSQTPTILPQEMQARHAKGSTQSPLRSKRNETPPVVHLIIPMEKHHVLSPIFEEGDMAKKSPKRTSIALPRSLINYTHEHLQEQNYVALGL